jgi:hypothetical protein
VIEIEKKEIKQRIKKLDAEIFELEKLVPYAHMMKLFKKLKEKMTLEKELEHIRLNIK